MWKLNQAIYGLRSSPKQWQDHIAEVLTALELTRLKTDSNVYRNKAGTAYIMVYVDDLLFTHSDCQSQSHSHSHSRTATHSLSLTHSHPQLPTLTHTHTPTLTLTLALKIHPQYDNL